MRVILVCLATCLACAAFTVWFVSRAVTEAGDELPAKVLPRVRGLVAESYDRVKNGVVIVRAERTNKYGRVTKTLATGVVVDPRGHVVTNNHVSQGTSRLRAVLPDDVTVPAVVLGSEPTLDLAVLKVKASKPLYAVALADGSDLMVGEPVIAVGNPHGYTHTVSVGIISALGRKVEMPDGTVLTGLIQTDASINPGSSGGPLFSTAGELVGINTALNADARGISFAVHVRDVKKVMRKYVGP